MCDEEAVSWGHWGCVQDKRCSFEFHYPPLCVCVCVCVCEGGGSLSEFVTLYSWVYNLIFRSIRINKLGNEAVSYQAWI